jgi:hypothetical protein
MDNLLAIQFFFLVAWLFPDGWTQFSFSMSKIYQWSLDLTWLLSAVIVHRDM